jgi:hypothetical protein
VKTKDLLELAEDPRFIPGIYNYCDRWCERCPLSARCLTYAMEQDDEDPSAHDLNNEAFWRKLQGIFEQTREMILTWAEEQGIELESVDVTPEMEEHLRRREVAKSHKLVQAARRYAKLVDEWFAVEGASVGQEQSSFATEWNLPIEDRVVVDEADLVHDAVEVIRWYQHQISVKLMRALMGDESEEAALELGGQKDSDGSAKVALIGMDRSLMAWGKLLDCRPEESESMLPILLHLERLRRKTEQTFPKARDFIRPGFDLMPDCPVQ